MQYSLLSLAFAALALANPMPQGVTSAIAPSTTAPAGCSSSYNGAFEIEVINVTTSSKRDLQKRAALVVTLANGVLTDAQGRTGYIAANEQFQFDGPPQTGAIYTSGWSVCSNGSLALGGNAIFYECLSGTFYNLYDENVGAQCAPIYIDVIPMGATQPASVISDGQVTAQPVTQITDGQPQASTGVVTQISDGQIQQPTGYPVSQISDGQIQATTATAAPVSQISDGQIQATTGAPMPVSQISDGQIQATTGTVPVVSQISDGQIQATTGAPMPVSQISDGQIQATTGTAVPVSQISDGQIQATTAPGPVVTQISDGQIQATTAVSPVSQISDGQPQAPIATGTGWATYSRNVTGPITPTSTPITPVGASPNAASGMSSNIGGGLLALAAMVLAVALL